MKYKIFLLSICMNLNSQATQDKQQDQLLEQVSVEEQKIIETEKYLRQLQESKKINEKLDTMFKIINIVAIIMVTVSISLLCFKLISFINYSTITIDKNLNTIKEKYNSLEEVANKIITPKHIEDLKTISKELDISQVTNQENKAINNASGFIKNPVGYAVKSAVKSIPGAGVVGGAVGSVVGGAVGTIGSVIGGVRSIMLQSDNRYDEEELLEIANNLVV